MNERVSTKTTAKILGASPGWVVGKMAMGELPIGIYTKNGNRADPKIFLGHLANYLRISRDELKQKIDEIEGGELECRITGQNVSTVQEPGASPGR